ncbi:MAG: hypothetical protein ABIJ05_04145 [Patescibacteria group bacterium]
MKKINFKKIIGLTAIIIIAVFLVLQFSKINKPTPTPHFQNGASYQNLIPGTSTREEIFQNLGSSLKERDENGVRILEYSSKNPNFNNELTVKDEKLSFVKEIVTLEDNIKIPNIINKYGNYENILYGPGSGVGFYLYIYSTKGIAYVGHQDSGLIKEIWYFPPTNFESFKSIYATNYSSTIQIIQ